MPKLLYRAELRSDNWHISQIDTDDPPAAMRDIRQSAIADHRNAITVRLNPSTMIYIRPLYRHIVIRSHDWLYIYDNGSKRVYFFAPPDSDPKSKLEGILWLIRAFRNNTLKTIAETMEVV
ncbi:MAG: hypothetical protein DRQ10_05800 [Candidatus Hydrothermota bacterium]|nr:MAG: hypothetical protein DRQ10_05800 [Candidatus Hydrothermae bacterium]